MIVDITANHQGYFIFKLCQNNDIFQDPKQSCFDQMPLWVGGGDPKFNHTRFPIHDYETGPILDRKKAKFAKKIKIPKKLLGRRLADPTVLETLGVNFRPAPPCQDTNFCD